MPIALVASNVQVQAASNAAVAARQDAADDPAGGSFNRMLLSAAASSAPGELPQTAPKAKTPAPKEKAASRPEGSVARPKPKSQETETEADETSAADGPSQPTVPTDNQAEVLEQDGVPVDATPVDEQDEQEQGDAASVMPLLTIAPPQIQEIQPQPQAEVKQTTASMQSTNPVGVTVEAPNQAGLTEDGELMSVESRSPEQPGSTMVSAADSLEASGDFADGLEHAVKKLSADSEVDEPAGMSTTAGPVIPAIHAAAGEPIVQPHASRTTAETLPPAPLEQQFAQANHGPIVDGIRTQLLPGGGTMQIRLTPPELGAMQVRVEMRGDILAATFQTSNDQAAQVLTHSLGQLKQALEQQGVSVGRLQVVSSPRNDGASTGENSGQSSTQWQGYQQQQNDQRREVLRQLWNRVAFGHDPIDVIA